MTPHFLKKTGRARTLQYLLVMLSVFTACTSPTPSPTPPAPPPTPTPELTATLSPTQTPAPILAPQGDPQKTYYAPFPVAITLDGELNDWASVPKVTVPPGADLNSGSPALTFAAASDGKFLYLMGDVIDNNIITDKHGPDYWNEDSVEFYVNGTGNLKLVSYQNGVAQITVPALNIGRSPETAVLSGVNGTAVNAQVTAAKTGAGYTVEVAVPLQNSVWEIPLAHGSVIGFQAHLNGASQADRDTKLIWSAFDTGDTSYQNPGVFGQLIFYEVGQTDQPVFQPTATALPTATFPAVEDDALYKKPTQPVEARVEDLLARMSMAEKFGQMTLVEKNSISSPDVTGLFIGGLLSGGGGSPPINTPGRWGAMVGRFQKYALDTRLGIPLIYGVDAVHGHNNMVGATIFPHNIGLGAANDEALMQRIGRVTSSEMIASGIYWDYAPVVAVPQDIRWGRTYEGYSENTDLVSRLSVAYLHGLQGEKLADPLSVLGTFKHFVGDGGTRWGSSTTGNYEIDQGVTEVDEATLRTIHLPPYIAGIKAGAQSIMISYSSWGGMKMHAQKHLITEVLKGELGFEGFVVSDWGGIDQISTNYYDSIVAGINAGVDLNMVPYDYARFLSVIDRAVQNGDISQERIDDAVRRILRVKFEMGLFEHPLPNESQLALVGSAQHRAVAQEAVSKSLVLLKNDKETLPLPKSMPLLYVAGQGANDIGLQSGGWTIDWQGRAGDITPGTTILEAINQTVAASTKVEYAAEGKFVGTTVADACLVVVGEQPYAEGMGDRADLALSEADVQLTTQMRDRCQKLAVIMLSGRPLIVTDQINQWDAFVAAWLPGTEGQGIADVLFGNRPFTGKLSFTWPRSMAQLPLDLSHPGTGDQGPLFPFGFGLTPK